MATSSIEWTEFTWNPATGCDKISAGCKFCYAEIMSRRLQAMGVKNMRAASKCASIEEALSIPYRWKRPAMVFVNSMSDLFHNDIPLEFIQKVFKVMSDCPHLIFQVLTKRGQRLEEVWKDLDWSENIWMGVSVENDLVTGRVESLRKVPAAVRFLSCEPLIGPLSNLNLDGIDWVIVGGESGLSPRPMKPEWAFEIRDQCEDHDVAFFFKQWGGRNKKAAGRALEGVYHDTFPQPKNRQGEPAIGQSFETISVRRNERLPKTATPSLVRAL